MVDDEEEGVVLTPDLALAEAANALSRAAEKAELLNDTESLMKIAGGWLEIHEYMTGTPHKEKKLPLGFVSTKSHELEEEEVEELDDAVGESEGPEGRSSSQSRGARTTNHRVRGVYPQHGELRITPSRYRGRG